MRRCPRLKSKARSRPSWALPAVSPPRILFAQAEPNVAVAVCRLSIGCVWPVCWAVTPSPVPRSPGFSGFSVVPSRLSAREAIGLATRYVCPATSSSMASHRSERRHSWGTYLGDTQEPQVLRIATAKKPSFTEDLCRTYMALLVLVALPRIPSRFLRLSRSPISRLYTEDGGSRQPYSKPKRQHLIPSQSHDE